MVGVYNGMWLVVLLSILGYSLKAQDEIFLFSYFKNNGEDGLHLAYSEDGFYWKALRDDRSFLTPLAGKDKLMRDPCIIQGSDGKFHMVWTVSWNERGIGYATSDDLIHWSEQRYLPVMEHEPMARNCWAPELFYDDQSERYVIYWSSTIPGRFPETDSSGDHGYNHRIYFTTTRDFKNFTETQIFYNHGFNVIDGTIQKINDEYILFLKDETRYPQVEKNIRLATSKSLTGPYSHASAAITDHWVEGPTVLKVNNEWIVYYDMYTKHKMGAVKSNDLKQWHDISEQIHFPVGVRHGTVFRVIRSVLDQIMKS